MCTLSLKKINNHAETSDQKLFYYRLSFAFKDRGDLLSLQILDIYHLQERDSWFYIVSINTYYNGTTPIEGLKDRFRCITF